jgi:hypothetical protein
VDNQQARAVVAMAEMEKTLGLLGQLQLQQELVDITQVEVVDTVGLH